MRLHLQKIHRSRKSCLQGVAFVQNLLEGNIKEELFWSSFGIYQLRSFRKQFHWLQKLFGSVFMWLREVIWISVAVSYSLCLRGIVVFSLTQNQCLEGGKNSLEGNDFSIKWKKMGLSQLLY